VNTLAADSPDDSPPQLPPISLRAALAYPFTQSNWLVALAYVGAIQFIPILGLLIIRGWRFDIARRVGAGTTTRLPDWRGATEHLKQGTLLFLVTIVHFIPLYILLAAPRWGIIWAVVDLVRWFYLRYFTVIEPPPLAEILDSGFKALVLFVVIMLVVPPILSAIVESATQRYAQTGRVRVLFEFWHSIRLACGDLGDVVRIEAGILLLNLVVFVVSLLLMMTVGGAAFIPPVMIPVYMWTRGALMGQWIRKNRAEEALAAQKRITA
jgi:hypothetical protein